MKRQFWSLVNIMALTCFVSEASPPNKVMNFYVRNAYEHVMTELWISPDRNTWSAFDLGKGIGPSEERKMVWDNKNDSADCIQYLMAMFAGGSASEPLQVDLCGSTEQRITFGD